MPYANNKGIDQPAHSHSLIIAFIVCCLDTIVSEVAMSEISRLQLPSEAEQASLSHIWLENSEDRFSHDVAQLFQVRLWDLRR